MNCYLKVFLSPTKRCLITNFNKIETPIELQFELAEESRFWEKESLERNTKHNDSLAKIIASKKGPAVILSSTQYISGKGYDYFVPFRCEDMVAVADAVGSEVLKQNVNTVTHCKHFKVVVEKDGSLVPEEKDYSDFSEALWQAFEICCSINDQHIFGKKTSIKAVYLYGWLDDSTSLQEADYSELVEDPSAHNWRLHSHILQWDDEYLR